MTYLPEFIKPSSASAMRIQFDVKEDDFLTSSAGGVMNYTFNTLFITPTGCDVKCSFVSWRCRICVSEAKEVLIPSCLLTQAALWATLTQNISAGLFSRLLWLRNVFKLCKVWSYTIYLGNFSWGILSLGGILSWNQKEHRWLFFNISSTSWYISMQRTVKWHQSASLIIQL